MHSRPLLSFCAYVYGFMCGRNIRRSRCCVCVVVFDVAVCVGDEDVEEEAAP